MLNFSVDQNGDPLLVPQNIIGRILDHQLILRSADRFSASLRVAPMRLVEPKRVWLLRHAPADRLMDNFSPSTIADTAAATASDFKFVDTVEWHIMRVEPLKDSICSR